MGLTHAPVRALLALALAATACRGTEPAIGSVASGGNGTGGVAAGGTGSGGSAGSAGGTGATGGVDSGHDGGLPDATVDVPPDVGCAETSVYWIAGPPHPTLHGRNNFVSAWTGKEALIWAGSSAAIGRSDQLEDGARFDPMTSGWTPIAAKPPEFISPARRFVGAWSQGVLFAWGAGPTVGLYAPETDTWTVVSPGGYPSVFDGASITALGGSVYVWGGIEYLPQALAKGNRFDLSTGTWQAISANGSPRPRLYHQGIAANDRLIAWGGVSSTQPDVLVDGGDIYDPAAGAWTQIPPAPNDVGRRFPSTVVWSGTELIVWGGKSESGDEHGDGAAYNPSSHTWRVIALGPSARATAAAVWTGREMLVYGGGDYLLAEVWLYDPVLDRWRHEAVCDAPEFFYPTVPYWTGTDALFITGRTVSVNRLVGLY